ncbi:hypothetical protein Q7P35_009476 [Cladosporium inversicolor]
MSFSGAIMAILLLLTLSIASPTTSLEATNSLHLKRQIATTPSLTLPSLPTITIDILLPPYVSLHSITARNAQALDSTNPPLESIVPFSAVTFEGDHGISFMTYNLHITNFSSALYRWTEVPVASSAGCLTRATNTTQMQWNCTAICGVLNEDVECSEVSACVKMGDGKGKDGRPSRANSAGRMVLGGHVVMAAMILVAGIWMLLWL